MKTIMTLETLIKILLRFNILTEKDVEKHTSHLENILKQINYQQMVLMQIGEDLVQCPLARVHVDVRHHFGATLVEHLVEESTRYPKERRTEYPPKRNPGIWVTREFNEKSKTAAYRALRLKLGIGFDPEKIGTLKRLPEQDIWSKDLILHMSIRRKIKHFTFIVPTNLHKRGYTFKDPKRNPTRIVKFIWQPLPGVKSEVLITQ